MKSASLLFLILLVGCSSQAPTVVVHWYDYQAKPPALAPGTPPAPPTALEPVNYQTVYDSGWDDPTLVIFRNDSYRKVRIEINGQQPIVLEARGITPDLHFGLGEHRVRIVTEKPTAAHGIMEVVRFCTVYIRPEGRSQIVHVGNWWY